MKSDGIFSLNCSLLVQETIYGSAAAELHSGKRRTHWKKIVFPQLDGLSYVRRQISMPSRSREQALAYFSDLIPTTRLEELADAVMAIKEGSVLEIFGEPDDLNFIRP